jgi:hypothetical protein
LKSDKQAIYDYVTALKYKVINLNTSGSDYMCIPEDDPVLNHLRQE